MFSVEREARCDTRDRRMNGAPVMELHKHHRWRSAGTKSRFLMVFEREPMSGTKAATQTSRLPSGPTGCEEVEVDRTLPLVLRAQ